ncbi:MAG TPA: VOC family protein [Lysobacter sp.]|nr:VOC family protein [Lysobacter sp.]
MNFVPYLNFDGRAREAFEFYARVLGGRIDFMQTYGDSPACDHVPAEMRDALIHIRMSVGEQVLLASDCPPAYFRPMQGLYVTVQIDDPAQARRVFEALMDGGQVQMPFEATFWSAGFGQGIDRYGTPWMVNCTRSP